MKKYLFLYILLWSFCCNSVTAQIDTDKRNKRHKIEFYHVQKSDNLYQISKKYGLKVRDLKSVNPGLTNDIHIGQIIIIPIYLTLEKEEAEGVKHLVKPKETLYALSKKFGVDIEAIKEANPIIKEKGLMVGYEIVIPTHKKQPIIDIKEEVSQAPVILKDTTLNVREYKVKLFERIKGISKREQVDLKEIYRLNPSLRKTKVRWGDIILLPKSINKVDEGDVTTYTIHYVSYFETLSDILKQYKITKEQFLTWNPNVELPLRLGTELKIKKVTENSSQDEQQYAECMNRKQSPFATYKIAVMIPFGLDEIPDDEQLYKGRDSKFLSFNFIQYYEGMLLAVDRLEGKGINAELYFYDVGKSESDAYEVLDDNLRTMDLIVGPIYNAPFKIVSNFAQQYGIKLINPLSRRQSIIEYANGVYKMQPSYQSTLKGMLSYVNNHFQDSASVYLVRNNKVKFTDEEQFFKNELEKMKIGHVKQVFTVNYIADSLHPIINHRDSATNNIVIGLFDKKINTIEFLRHLNQFHDSIPNLTLMGFPDWSDFEIDNGMLQNLNTHIFDHRFVDYTLEETKWFVRNFRERFFTEPQVSKFAFIGYDVLLYFVTAMQKYGYDFEDCIQYYHYRGLQNQISLTKKSNGCFENQAVTPIWYHDFEKRQLRE